MRHRHLTAGEWSASAVDDMLDRGLPSDWLALRRAVDADPTGRIATLVLRMCAANHRYGTSKLWTSYVMHLRNAPAESTAKSGDDVR